MINFDKKIKEMKEIQKELDATYKANIDIDHLNTLIDMLNLTCTKKEYHYTKSMSGMEGLKSIIDYLETIREAIKWTTL